MFLKRLSGGYLVGKDPDASLFYREKGNQKFQAKDYMGAAVLYSKVRPTPSRAGGAVSTIQQCIFLQKTEPFLLSGIATSNFVY